MMTPQTVNGYVKAEPFRAFRSHLASGRTFDIRHPEMVKVLKNNLLISKTATDTPEMPDEWESVSLLLAESISPLEDLRSINTSVKEILELEVVVEVKLIAAKNSEPRRTCP